MKIIFINAIAARNSGALSIIKDFYNYITDIKSVDIKYYLFTCIDEFQTNDSIEVVKLEMNGWLNRIVWDEGGLEKWALKNKLIPDCIVSFQNTSTRWNKNLIPQIVYYHQALPFTDYKFNVFLKEERLLFLYQKFYFFFVNRNNKNTTYVVQLPFLQEALLKKTDNNRPVKVITPNTPILNRCETKKLYNKFTFLYPATPLRYKNHKIIIKALIELSKSNQKILSEIKIFFTVNYLSKQLEDLIKKNKLENYIKYIGVKSYKEMLSLYETVDAVLFSSEIESYGLPLIEAASFGLPIISSDLRYAREVLFDYDNIIFVDPNKEDAWAEAIGNYSSLIKSNPLKRESQNTWKQFVDILVSIIYENNKNQEKPNVQK